MGWDVKIFWEAFSILDIPGISHNWKTMKRLNREKSSWKPGLLGSGDKPDVSGPVKVCVEVYTQSVSKADGRCGLLGGLEAAWWHRSAGFHPPTTIDLFAARP